MKGSIGCPTRIVTVVPHMRELAKGTGSEFSAKAKFRLKVFDWYFKQSKYFSLTGVQDASLTCRHFGIQTMLRIVVVFLPVESALRQDTACITRKQAAGSKEKTVSLLFP